MVGTGKDGGGCCHHPLLRAPFEQCPEQGLNTENEMTVKKKYQTPRFPNFCDHSILYEGSEQMKNPETKK